MKYSRDSTNGDGLRVSLFVSGCSLISKEFTEETMDTLLERGSMD